MIEDIKTFTKTPFEQPTVDERRSQLVAKLVDAETVHPLKGMTRKERNKCLKKLSKKKKTDASGR